MSPLPRRRPPDERHRRRRSRLVAALLLAAMALLWLARQPLFAIRAITRRRRRRAATASRRSAPTPRRSLAGNFLTHRPARGAARLRVGALGPPCGGATRLAESPARAARGAPAGRALGRRRAGQPRSSSTASARCSRPTSATSRTTTCRRSTGPTAARRRCWRCSPASSRLVARSTRASRRCTLSGRGSWQATLDSGAVVELGRGSDDDVAGPRRALRRHRATR